MQSSQARRLLLLGFFASAAVLNAADLIKADNTTNLATAGAWTDSAAIPTNADTLVFNDTLQGNFAFNWGNTAPAARGIRLTNPAGAVAITLNSNSYYGLGVSNSATGSIDMSAATANLTIIAPNANAALRFYHVNNTSPANISVAEGTTLTLQTRVFSQRGGGVTGIIRISGAGNVTVDGTRGRITDSDTSGNTRTGITHDGTGTITLASANTYTGNTVLNSGNFLLAGTGALRFNLATGNQITGATAGEVRFNGTFNVLVGDTPFGEDTTWTLVAGTFGDLAYGNDFSLSLTGSVVGSGITLDRANNYAAGNWSYNTSTGALMFSAIPEPSTYAAFAGIGILGLAVVRRRRDARS
ncbi:MAG TPA: PEP-CTERM sorting domain-containing protein [Rariglobus sp.]